MNTPFLDKLIEDIENHIEHVEAVSCAGIPETRKELAEYQAIKEVLKENEELREIIAHQGVRILEQSEENEELRGWKSINDSMPNYYDHVLVYEPQSIYMAWLAVGDDGEYLWTVANSDGILRNVTHWKSLKPFE